MTTVPDTGVEVTTDLQMTVTGGPSTLGWDDAVAAALALADRPGPAILGLTGAPGAGKSTYAEDLVAEMLRVGRLCVLVPMDGFHLAQSALDRLGLADVKGAPQTFDVGGYVDLLRRLREPGNESVWAPVFDRAIENPIGSAIEVPPTVDLVVTEGNYLLLPQGLWWHARLQLDACWYVDTEDEVRRGWLQARHEEFGRSPEAAAERTNGSDEANARLVSATRGQADAYVTPRPA